MSCRPVTTASGRHVRLGTASMLTEPGGPFIDVSKLNIVKYAQKPALSKVCSIVEFEDSFSCHNLKSVDPK